LSDRYVQRAVSKEHVLHGGEFIAQAQNVVFIGGPGTGKTH